MCDLSGSSVNVGESMITQSSKVRDLGVIFDQFLNFDDHITDICRSTHINIRNIINVRSVLTKSPDMGHITPILEKMARNSRYNHIQNFDVYI